MRRKIIYTACFGAYDNKQETADRYFSEDNNPYDGCSEHLSSRLKAKMYKVLNPLSYDLWIDASVTIINRRKFFKVLGGDLCLFKHPFNKTILDELNLCYKIGHIDDNQRNKIIELYKSANMRVEEVPVYAGGVLYRTRKVEPLNQLWWSLICQYSSRDQLTLTYAIKQFPNVKLKVLDLDIFDNKYLKVHEHNK